MKYVLVFALLAVAGFVPAAPRPAVKPVFLSFAAEGKYALVDDFACEKFTATFTVNGKPNTTYTVELYVEGNGTGERAILVQSATVTTDQPPGGTANGTLRAGTESSGITSIALLPNVGKGKGWAFCLVLKEGERIVADTGFSWVRYPGKPD